VILFDRDPASLLPLCCLSEPPSSSAGRELSAELAENMDSGAAVPDARRIVQRLQGRADPGARCNAILPIAVASIRATNPNPYRRHCRQSCIPAAPSRAGPRARPQAIPLDRIAGDPCPRPPRHCGPVPAHRCLGLCAFSAAGPVGSGAMPPRRLWISTSMWIRRTCAGAI
jgi:hypothetical protein